MKTLLTALVATMVIGSQAAAASPEEFAECVYMSMHKKLRAVSIVDFVELGSKYVITADNNTLIANIPVYTVEVDKKTGATKTKVGGGGGNKRELNRFLSGCA